MKIALVGPGLMPIPPKGWGAVEMLIWKYSENLMRLGHEVTIFNSQDLAKVARDINAGGFDFIHVHYDDFARFFSKHLNKPFCITSHYGLLLYPEHWSRGYFSIFADFLGVPGIIALTPEIKKRYLDNGYEGSVYVLKNGVNVSEFSFTQEGNGRALYLGKIEPRKRQAELAKLLDGVVEIDFVGPLADENFKEGTTTHYLGVWSQEDVRKKLTEYSTLVLMSYGEAAPMVVIEALASGVSVVISHSASGNIEPCPFVTVLTDGEKDSTRIGDSIRKAIVANKNIRQVIRNYAKEKFDNEAIMYSYQSLMTDFKNRGVLTSTFHARAVFIRKHLFRYSISRTWLLLSKVKILRVLYKRI